MNAKLFCLASIAVFVAIRWPYRKQAGGTDGVIYLFLLTVLPRWLWLAFGKDQTLSLLSTALPVGLALFFWSQRSLATAWTGDIKIPSLRITSGPYAYLRHPMYLSYIIMQLGHASYSTWLPFWACIPYYLIRIHKENKLLT